MNAAIHTCFSYLLEGGRVGKCVVVRSRFTSMSFEIFLSIKCIFTQNTRQPSTVYKGLQHAAIFIATNVQQECSSVKLYHHNPKL